MNDKKRRNLERSRALLDQVSEENRAAVLNSIYSVSPVDFDPPELRRRIRETFPAGDTPLSLATLNLMRLYRKSAARKIAICGMPKSGSTFILTSLRRLKALDFKLGYLHVPYDNPSFVDAVECENEIDEMALLRLEILGRNTLAHIHTKCSPYTEKLLATHGYRPVIVQRNIFDCVVSMDDMLRRGHVPGFGMVHPPRDYHALPRETRLAFLCSYVGPWYIDFAVTWARTRLTPLFLDYETDIRGFDRASGETIRAALGLEEVPLDDFIDAFDLRDDQRKRHARFNEGASGRGQMIPRSARENIYRLADLYSGEVDFSGLL